MQEKKVKLAEEKLAVRLRYEESIAYCSKTLFVDKDIKETVNKVLKSLLKASQVSRVYIFENVDDEKDGLCMRQLYEVCAAGINPEIDNPILLHLPYKDGFERWSDLLSRKEAVYGYIDTFPAVERNILEPQGILSILILPIWVEGRWYGFIGFDDTVNKRLWNEEDIRLLRTAAEMIGAYIGRKKAEESLVNSEKRYRLISENTDDLIAITTFSLRPTYKYISSSCKRIVGYDPQELLGKCALDFLHPEDIKKLFPLLKKYVLDKVNILKDKNTNISQTISYRYKNKEGNWRYFESTANLVREDILFISRDITERKKAEEKLKKSEKHLSNALRIAKLGHWEYDVKKKKFTFTDEFYNIFRTSAEQAGGYTMSPERYADLFVYPDDRPVVMTEVQKALKTKDPNYNRQLEHRIVYADGETGYITVRIFVIKDEKGRTIKTYGVNQDITERKKAEEKLNKTNSELQALIQAIPDVVYFKDIDSRYLIVNKAFEELTGCSQSEIIGRTDFDLLPPELAESCIKGDMELLKKKKMQRDEEIMGSGDGNVFIYDTIKSPIKDENNSTIGLVGVSRDITARRNTEEKLRKSEERFRDISYSMGDWIWEVDNEGRFTFVGGKVEQILGYTPEELTGKSVFELIVDEQRQEIKDIFEARAPEKIPFVSIEHWDVAKNGKRICLRTSGVPMLDGSGELLGYRGVNSDITEYVLATEKLRESEERFRAVVESSKDAMIAIDEEGLITTFNPAAEKMFGYDSTDMVNKHLDLLMPKEYRDIHKEHVKNFFAKGKPDCAIEKTLELPALHRDGYIFPVELSLSKGQYGRRRFVLAVMRDITERKKAQKMLMEYRKALESSDDCISAVDSEYKNIFANEAFLSTMSLKPEEVIGRTITELIGEEDFKNELKPNIDRALKGEPMQFEVYQKKLKSGIFDYLMTFYPLFDEDKNITGVVIIGKDITKQKKSEAEKKELERQLFQAQKLDSIGRLAGGIAHDFNNILTSIMGHAELLKLEFDDVLSSQGQSADMILKGVERAADLTKQLLGFARGGKYNPVPLNINEVIKETINVSGKIFDKNIDLEFDFEDDIDSIVADRNQIDQVLTNIIINAKEAMLYGGTLRFKTMNICLGEQEVKIVHELKQGKHIIIKISDTGVGMPEEIKERVFEPFYTTKGEGTGLGLATVYGIIKNHNGHIECCSEPGKGTTFIIYLPSSDRKVLTDREEKKCIKGDATILVVDDEPAVRSIIEKQLTDLGYSVVLAENGCEALEIYRKRGSEIDLVLLDIIMPVMAGEETFIKLKKLNHNAKVIIMSGYSEDGKAVGILRQGVNGFVQKPFKLQKLSEVVSEVLNN